MSIKSLENHGKGCDDDLIYSRLYIAYHFRRLYKARMHLLSALSLLVLKGGR